jgi:hypothetical protein
MTQESSSIRSLSRRQWIGVATGGVATLAGVVAYRRFGTGAGAAAEAIPVTLYAGADCACCHKWAAHMNANGFTVATVNVADVGPEKDKRSVPAELRSCHTAEIGGYVVEGHVPAGDIKRFLAERSSERGLAVPGMPGGSPGMESDPKVPFDVIAFSASGKTRVFAQG